MEMRRIFFQFGALAGCAAFGITLWLALSRGQLDLLQACLRAVGAGIAILLFTVFISGIVEKLGGSAE